MSSPPFISSALCEKLIDPARAVDLAELALRWESSGEVEYPMPRALRMKAQDKRLTFHSKAVAVPAIGVLGCRIVSYRVEADGSRPGADSSTRLVMLIDLDTGSPLAILDEHYNYSLRTAASIGVAARYLSGPRPVLGLVGAGAVAKAVADVMLETLPLEAVYLFSRSPARCQALADRVSAKTDLPVTVCDSLDQLISSANVVVTATTTRAPFIKAEDLRPGALLCALGSNELEGEAYLSCDRLIVDDWLQTESAADIAGLIADGFAVESKLSAELPEIVAGSKPGRQSATERIIVRTEGLASQDIALAHWAWQEAERQGLCQSL
ncbi:MAG: alanine dehydrogenase [Kribbellaceae bacterium]|jgi:ornithine cyclodeaminase/alanine dehydrogenase-like protein (mu-crystallin family)|nr:alanine dehydrogenase [Kribbellaceae bacterium]